MKNIVKTLALVLVFFILTPGIFVRLPIKGGIYKIAAIHAVLFGVICFIVVKLFGVLREGLTPSQCRPNVPTANANANCNAGNSSDPIVNGAISTTTTGACNSGKSKRCTKIPAVYEWQFNNITAQEATCPRGKTNSPCVESLKGYCNTGGTQHICREKTAQKYELK